MPDLALPALAIERHTLDNGLRVVVHPDDSLPLVALNLWYHVGSKNDRPGCTGLAHLFEHMLFQGSQHVGTNDHFRLIQQAGGVANGSTWFDRTNYYETLPAHYLDLGLWLEADRLGFLLPALDLEKLENQRGVVMNERRQRIDNQPYGRAFERLNELLYPEHHPYHWPVIGYMDDIAAATIADVSSFFRSYYAPNNAVLTLAGDLEVDHALDRVEHFFGDIPSGEPLPSLTVPTLEPETSRSEVMEDDVQLPRLYLAFHLPRFGSPDWYAADLLAFALSSGKSSPLYRDLVYERQIATDVSAFVLPTELAASFILVATGKPETEIEELDRGVRRYLEETASGRLATAHIERARNKILTAFCDDLQNLDQRADLLSMFTTYFDDPHKVSTEWRTYLSLSLDDLTRVCRDFLTGGGVRLAVVPRSRPA